MASTPSLIDRLIVNADQMLRTVSPRAAKPFRPTPAEPFAEIEMDDRERRHVAGLMRINHTGEVCAQALYQGQALTARLDHVQSTMEKAAEEEIDHLVWCEDRLHQLGSRTSLLNPVWYALSFGVGAVAGAISDRVSLGFVAATEDRVCEHLNEHLQQVPTQDQRTRAILEQMLVDEAAHATHALANGGVRFPEPVKKLMTLVSKAMTKTTYYV